MNDGKDWVQRYEEVTAERDRLRSWLAMRVEERLADYLRSLAVSRDDALVVVQPPTGEKLAEAIGSCRETVSRLLADWNRRGLIAIRRAGGGEARGITLTPELFVEMDRVHDLGRKPR